MRRGRQPPASAPPPRSLRTAAVALLGRRDLTRSELTERLLARGYPSPEVETTVDDLVAKGLVDDRRTALGHVRTASRIKGRGRLRIQRELEARGVARHVIHDVLADLSPEDDLTAIRRFLAKRRLPSDPSPGERRKLFQQLLRRGFSSGAIAKVLRNPDETGDE